MVSALVGVLQTTPKPSVSKPIGLPARALVPWRALVALRSETSQGALGAHSRRFASARGALLLLCLMAALLTAPATAFGEAVPRLALSKLTLPVSNGRVALPVRCTGAKCVGRLLLQNIKQPGARIATAASRKPKAITYGSATVKIKRGARVTVTVALNGTGKTALETRKTMKVWANFTLGSTKLSRQITLSLVVSGTPVPQAAAQRRHEEEAAAKKHAEEEARKKHEEEAAKKAEEEARKKHEEEAGKKREEEAAKKTVTSPDGLLKVTLPKGWAEDEPVTNELLGDVLGLQDAIVVCSSNCTTSVWLQIGEPEVLGTYVGADPLKSYDSSATVCRSPVEPATLFQAPGPAQLFQASLEETVCSQKLGLEDIHAWQVLWPSVCWEPPNYEPKKGIYPSTINAEDDMADVVYPTASLDPQQVSEYTAVLRSVYWPTSSECAP